MNDLDSLEADLTLRALTAAHRSGLFGPRQDFQLAWRDFFYANLYWRLGLAESDSQ